MAKRIPWSKHEIALLFMAYENVVNGSSMKEQAFWLSDNLRRLASINGIVIDGTFRNINGMNMQLGNVQFLFTGGEKGLSGASRAIRNMYDIFVNDHDQFVAILREATTMLNTEVESNAQSPKNSANDSDTTHKPIIRISWDKYETALLFKAYESITRGEDYKSEAVKLSNTLRQYAINRGIKINETYRNVNGMNMHLAQVQYLFTGGNKGLPSCSKAIKEMYELYQSDYNTYLSLLKEAIRLSQAPECINDNCSNEVSPEHIERIESYVLKADLNGCTVDETAMALELPVLTVKKAVASSIDIVSISDRLIHKEAFVDWEVGADCLQAVLEKLMEKNNGYVSAAQLYDYAKLDMAMFMNDNDMGDQRKIFDMAEHLFSKEKYHDVHYSFQGKAHITSSQEIVTSKLDIIMKYARDQGGFFSENDLEEYLHLLGINNTHSRQYMKLSSAPDFLFYKPGYIITSESIGITPEWLNKARKAVKTLFNDVGDHIVIRDIQPMWYDLLPDLPGGRAWTPLLLQSILRFYYNEIGAKTICALNTQSIHCSNCLTFTDKGCIIARSLSVTIGGNSMNLKGMNCYQNFGFQQNFLEHFMTYGTDCFSRLELGNLQYVSLKKWLEHAMMIEIANKDRSVSVTPLGEKLIKFGAYNPFTWAIIWANLCYNSVICRWFCLNAELECAYENGDFVVLLGDSYSQTTRKNAVGSLLATFRFSPIGSALGQGIQIDKSYLRAGWDYPDPVALLYSLYLYAERTGHKSFTFSELVNSRNVENASGVSPHDIYGIDAKTFKEQVQGLAVQYPKYIRVSFVANLDNIVLEDFASQDILDLAED